MTELALTLGQALYLFAPLLVASLLSAIVIKLDLLRFAKRPIDGGASLGSVRLFGDSKTWRGVIVAVTGSAAASLVQHVAITDHVGALALVRHDTVVSAVALGALIGLGAMIGELPNSFVKRRAGIAPGKTTKGPLSIVFYVWDQVDLVTGAWPFIALFMRPSWGVVVASFLLALGLHPLVSLIGWLIGARKTAR